MTEDDKKQKGLQILQSLSYLCLTMSIIILPGEDAGTGSRHGC